MKKILLSILLLLTLPVAAQTQEKQITVTENVAQVLYSTWRSRCSDRRPTGPPS